MSEKVVAPYRKLSQHCAVNNLSEKNKWLFYCKVGFITVKSALKMGGLQMINK